MERKRDFHKQVRVVYRAMRRFYGIERVQDECLRVFKIVYPLLYKARTTEEYGFTDDIIKKLEELFSSWKIKDGELSYLLCEIQRDIYAEYSKEEFIQYCEDIMPVIMRIRKLTPRECGRLMGCDDKTIDIMENCGVSKSALYKLYGNSIVEDVLYHIFRKLFIETERDIVKGEVVQLSLF